ncbi:MAG: archaellin/type IV pilin N-terminal domain-containing protein [Acidilobaceae archaeon]
MINPGKGLSPLVATLILIAFTVIGGILVYEYFTKTSEGIMSSGEQLIVTASKSYVDGSRYLVYVEVTNNYRTNVTITGFKIITDALTTVSTITPLQTSENNIQPGGKYTAILTAPINTKAIIIDYKVRGSVLSKTIPLS